MSEKKSQKSQKSQKTLGNTKPKSNTSKFRARRYVLTYNNYTEKDFKKLTEWCKVNTIYYVLGRETAKTGTKHIQGYIEFKNQKAFSILKKSWPKIHFEKAKGNKSQNLTYCSKENNFIKKLNFQEKLTNKLLKKYDKIIWKKWQQDILDFIAGEPDDRIIYWIHESIGNIGKSFLAKYIVLKYKCIIADGKKDNIFNQVKTSLDNEIEPKIIILDIPRYNLEYVNYGCLEQLKNGMLYSGKYEGGICLFDNPHIIIFANEKPDMTKMSIDRWKIVNLNKPKVYSLDNLESESDS